MSGQGEPGPQGTPESTAQTSGEQVVARLAEANEGSGTPPASAESQPAGNQQPAQGGGESQQAQPPETWGSEFLESLDEAQRKQLEPLINKWDAGVTRRFQELQTRYAPLQPLLESGVDVAEVSNALQIYNLLDTNPNYLYQLLKTELESGEGGAEGGVQGQQGLQGEEEYDLPPQVRQELDQLRQVVEALAQSTLDQRSQATEAQEDASLDEYLGLLKAEKGEFDEHYVLSRMMQGMDGAAAVDAWNSTLQGFLQQAGQGNGAPPVPGSNLPPVLSGGGVPVTTENITTAKDKDVKDMVVKMLEQSAANNH